MQGHTLSESIEKIKVLWTELLPETPFSYAFLDSTLEQVYTQELQLKKASYVATALALIMVFLGVFGLVTLNIHKRIKELGLRIVLGASWTNISYLFFKEFFITK